MKIAFMLSGQGAQTPGMMKDICEKYSEAKRVFDTAEEALGRNISEFCFTGTDEELALTHNTQPCVLAADLAAAVALSAEHMNPDVIAGFSVGEYGALVEAGVVAMKDAFRLVQIRADAMQEAVPIGRGAMAAIIGASDDAVAELCDSIQGYVVPANYNSPVQTVVSGEREAVDQVVALAEEKGLRALKLAVSCPFHCDLMRPAAEKIKTEFQNMDFSNPTLPVYMNVDASVLTSGENAKELMYRQAMSAVLWKQTLLKMRDDGADIFIECGPGKTLYNLARKTLPKNEVTILRVSDLETLNKTISTLQGLKNGQ